MNIRHYRDQILQATQTSKPSRASTLTKRAIHSLGFVLAFRLALEASEVLVLQFVAGAVILFALDAVFARFSKPKAKGPVALPPELAKRDPFELALLQGLMSLEAARKREFPIQQNALLALALISLPSMLYGLSIASPRWLIFLTPLAAMDFAIRTWMEARDESARWLDAATALDA